jgi:hypothetical protein
MEGRIRGSRRARLAAAVSVAALLSGGGGLVTAAIASDKSWNIGAYNVAAWGYGGFTTVSGATADSIPVPEKYRWQAWDVWVTGARQTHVANRLTANYQWVSGTSGKVDVAGVQEAGTHYVTYNSSLDERAQRESLKIELNSQGYQFAVPFNILDSAVGDTPQRVLARASHVVYRASTMSVIQSGTGTAYAFIADSYKSDYQLALGATNKDKLYPWAVLRTTGANATEPNRSLLVASVHSTARNGYAYNPGIITTFNHRFFNGEVQRGVAKALKDLSTAGSGGVSGMPTVIMGDLNDYYAAETIGTLTAKSPPKLLSDWGMWDARTAYKQTSDNCTNNSACQPWGTMNTLGGKGNVIDYIFTYYTGTKTLIGTFKTVADDWRISDHKMIAARVRYS